MQRARNEETTQGIARLRDELGQLGWYHSIQLADGRVIKGLQSIEILKERIARYPIPEDLTGKRVLDIGAWDGWFSFEMERRGASVVALDSARQNTLLEAKKLLNSKVEYVIGDICRLTARDLGYFDIVLFFGVLYHLKHPLLALENVCEMTKDFACMESLVVDDASAGTVPMMEFYEGTELAGQFDNWVGPNIPCFLAFCRTAGFVNVELKTVLDSRAHVIGFRKWPEIVRSGVGPELVCVENTWTRNHDFANGRDDYFTAWISSDRTDLTCDNVFVKVGPYACRPVGVRNIGGPGWQVNCKLAPGLSRGWQDVTVSLDSSEWSNRLRIGIDLPRAERRASTGGSDAIQIAGVTDGKTYESNRVRIGVESCLSVWASGIERDKHDVTVRLDGTDLPAVYVSTADDRGLKQVNAMLPPGMDPGEYLITVSVRGVESRALPVRLE
jgi:tRNA (mo5U34)-methyltransferase